MFAIAFDMSVKLLKEHYGEPYNNAYYEIGVLLKEYDFYNTQGSVYLTPKNEIGTLFEAIDALSDVEWFVKSVRDVRAFRVEDWSNLTDYVRKKGKKKERKRMK
jgi:virulence-associated protein VapD